MLEAIFLTVKREGTEKGGVGVATMNSAGLDQCQGY